MCRSGRVDRMIRRLYLHCKQVFRREFWANLCVVDQQFALRENMLSQSMIFPFVKLVYKIVLSILDRIVKCRHVKGYFSLQIIGSVRILLRDISAILVTIVTVLNK